MTEVLYFKITLLIILLVLSGMFSGSETSIMGMSIAKIKQMEEVDEKGAKTLKRLKKKLSSLLITILIGNNIVNIAATALLTELTVEYFTGANAAVIVTVIMTILILIFGEITPKTYASHNPEKVAVKLGGFLELLDFLFKPISIVLKLITNFFIKTLGGDINHISTFVTEEEIRSLVDVGEEEGIVNAQEREMIDGVFEIDEMNVSEIMVPRIDVVAVEESSTLYDFLEIIRDYGHSRIPVYKESIDNIIGIIHAKDLLILDIINMNEDEAVDISTLMRPAFYVPENKKISDLLVEFKQKKTHMAIILDEYGGTEGIVTIEDVIEEIVGDIFDEYDDEVKLIEKINDKHYIVKGDIDLEEIEELFNVEFPEQESYGSLGGYIFNTLGRVPEEGDKVEYRGLVMTVKKLVNRRIIQIEIEVT
ncbi:hemolysin family protein [Oceanirhabdus seepicola]|uniref:HlyC/CorC family transporter n=1 Tax=Oceanirhabdus seepicola TaxID=2828781 RepID=A0A9J6NVX4_9CLOT|nr:hemolysin family protein [Oceanirhabdus seepicola]MCM1988634.1 HlyC/CorC family transporter [Oceanirhabdus seepicola]